VKIYRGYRQPGTGLITVTVADCYGDGLPRPLDARLDLLYAPGGLDWGAQADGRQLALALAADAMGGNHPVNSRLACEDALDVYQSVKLWLVRGLAIDGWRLTDVDVLCMVFDIWAARRCV
jgi:hypothetical protein